MSKRQREKRAQTKLNKPVRSERHKDHPSYWMKVELIDNPKQTQLMARPKAKRLTSTFIVLDGMLRNKADLGIPVLWKLV